METLVEKVTWRRRGVQDAFVGQLHAGDQDIRLTGRDPYRGIDVSLSIPATEVGDVHVAPGAAAGDLVIVLELDGAEPVFLHPLGCGPLHVQVLARKLGALVHRPLLLAQGG